jgi:hypothetical protein
MAVEGRLTAVRPIHPSDKDSSLTSVKTICPDVFVETGVATAIVLTVPFWYPEAFPKVVAV